MKRGMTFIRLIGYCLLCVVMVLQPARADFNSHPELPVLIQESDVICIGSVKSVRLLDRTEFDSGFSRDGQESMIQVQKAVAQFSVEKTLKGHTSRETISISFFKLIDTNVWSTLFTELIPKTRVILFLNAPSKDGSYPLADPASNGYSQIPIESTAISSMPESFDALRAALLILTHALADPTLQADCLDRIESAGILIYRTPGRYEDNDEVKLRSLIDESQTSALEKFIREQIQPAVVPLIHSTNPKISSLALYTAAALQDVDIIPELVKNMKPDQPGHTNMEFESIRSYRNPAAVKQLIPLLKSLLPEARENSVYALGEIPIPAPIPFLLDDLDDPDPETRHMVINALIEITGDIPDIETRQEPDREKAYIAFWHDWATKNKDEVDALRAQFMLPSEPGK